MAPLRKRTPQNEINKRITRGHSKEELPHKGVGKSRKFRKYKSTELFILNDCWKQKKGEWTRIEELRVTLSPRNWAQFRGGWGLYSTPAHIPNQGGHIYLKLWWFSTLFFSFFLCPLSSLFPSGGGGPPTFLGLVHGLKDLDRINLGGDNKTSETLLAIVFNEMQMLE